jgi:hypothetical protein
MDAVAKRFLVTALIRAREMDDVGAVKGIQGFWKDRAKLVKMDVRDKKAMHNVSQFQSFLFTKHSVAGSFFFQDGKPPGIFITFIIWRTMDRYHGINPVRGQIFHQGVACALRILEARLVQKPLTYLI